MADVTGRIGDADVALDNAATETTLRALLMATAASKAEYKKLMAMASKTLDPKKVDAVNQSLTQNDKVLKTGMIAAKVLGGAFSILGSVLGDITASAFKTVGNLTNFAKELFNGTASVSGIFAAFKDLPLGLGAVAGLFETLAKITEENLNAFRQLSKVGVNLGGDLNQIRVVASSVGLSMQEYGEVIAANSETLSLLGKNADEGAAAFVKINKGLTTGNLANQLLSLGYGFRDINELTASYIKINGGLTSSQLKNTNQIQQSVINYGKELDVLARLTGKSREALQKQQEEQAADLNFQSYLNGLDENERAKANAALQLAMESGGKGAADALKAKLMGLPPLTEEAQMYYATMQSGRQSIEDFADTVKNGKTLQQSQNQLDKIFSQAVAGNIKDLAQFRTVLAAGGMTGDKFSASLQGVEAAVARYRKSGMTEEAAIQAALNDARKKQIAQQQSGAAQAAESERALKALSAELIGALLPVFQILTPIVQDLAQQFMGFAKKNMPLITDTLTKFVTAVADFLKDLFSPGGVDRTMTKIEKFVELLVGKLMDMILKKLNPFHVDLTPEQQVQSTQMRQNQESGLTETPGLGAYASGGITNKPSIFGDAGWEAAVPLPDGRTIPVTLKMPDQPTNTSMASVSNDGNSKDLLDELQLLNKNIATLITHSKANVDIGRSNLDAIKGLDGNLFA
jgi:hypothetical protein